ncbi:MAG: glutathione S-transferase family protein [Archangium sp.]
MRLLQFTYSPFAAKLRTILKLKNLACELVDVPYLDRSELVKLTGALYVPVLQDGETVISDSARIVQYLEKKGGPTMYGDPLASVLEQWADEYFEEVAFKLACPGLEERMGRDQGLEAKALFRLIKERRYGSGIIAQWKRDETQYREQTLTLLQPIVDTLKKRPWLVGDSVSVADAAVAGQLTMVEFAFPEFVAKHAPSLSAWYAKLKV